MSPWPAAALAGSLETASKGLIFEEATASVPAEGLRRALKPVVEEITKDGGARAEREVAVVLRAMERGARHEGGQIPDGDTSYLDLVGRVFQQRPQQPRAADGSTPAKPPASCCRDRIRCFPVLRSSCNGNEM